MIKIEHVVLTSPEQMEFIIEGMRNPMNSWEKSDSGRCSSIYACDIHFDRCDKCIHSNKRIGGNFAIGDNDHSLMQRLAKAGTDHRKFMRMMPVYVRITAPLYWWKEFDTYKIGTVANSCSTMHKIADKEFTLEDFSCEHLMDDELELMKDIIARLNENRLGFLELSNVDKTAFEKAPKVRKINSESLEKGIKRLWWQMIQLLPSSYNQTRNVMMNYEVLANIYKSRKNHKLDEWREFCKWIEELPYSELIIGNVKEKAHE